MEIRDFLYSLDSNLSKCNTDEQYKMFIKNNKEELKKKLSELSEKDAEVLDKLFDKSEITNDKDKYS